MNDIDKLIGKFTKRRMFTISIIILILAIIGVWQTISVIADNFSKKYSKANQAKTTSSTIVNEPHDNLDDILLQLMDDDERKKYNSDPSYRKALRDYGKKTNLEQEYNKLKNSNNQNMIDELGNILERDAFNFK